MRERERVEHGRRVQGYLAHKNQPPPPQGFHRALGLVVLKVPRGVLFLMGEVPLYTPPRCFRANRDQ